MATISTQIKFFLNLAKLEAVMGRRFDRGLGGLGFSEFILLYHLSQARDEKLSRIDLAEKIGLTASGVTRLLLPMEKVGLIKREADKQDARVSFVCLASGGKRKFSEALERAEQLTDEIISAGKVKDVEKLSNILTELGSTVLR
jgi:DNA-binding MarR family transcriptional regulator